MKRKLFALLTAIMCVTSVPYTAMAKESGQYAEMKAVNVDIKQDIVRLSITEIKFHATALPSTERHIYSSDSLLRKPARRSAMTVQQSVLL